MSCERLNIGFSPSSPDNNDKTDGYNNYFTKNVPSDNRSSYYSIPKSKEFLENTDNMSILTEDNYKLLLDLTGYEMEKKQEKFKIDIPEKILGWTSGLKNLVLSESKNNLVLSESKNNKLSKKGDTVYIVVIILITILIITLFNAFK